MKDLRDLKDLTIHDVKCTRRPLAVSRVMAPLCVTTGPQVVSCKSAERKGGDQSGEDPVSVGCPHRFGGAKCCFVFFFTLVTGPRRSLNLGLSDTRVYRPQKRARLGAGKTLPTQIRGCEMDLGTLQCCRGLLGRLPRRLQDVACSPPSRRT